MHARSFANSMSCGVHHRPSIRNSDSFVSDEPLRSTSVIAPGKVFAIKFCGRVAPQLGAVSRSDTAILFRRQQRSTEA
jgi:hypothetical protein